ncbi:MAG: LEA type 2 family protein [Crocinitomicaceae bacterium]|nr:LEA type 2 family protein [Crocinitomicaceae bacterium]
MKHLILSLLTVFVVNAYANEKPDYIEFSEPEVTGMDNFSVERKNGKMHIGFDFIIKNPNKMGVVIKPSSLHLNVAGQDMGWVRVEEKIKIKRKSEDSYPFMLVGNSEDFVKSAFSGIWDLITGSGIDFNIKGTVKAGVFFFKKKWKIDFTYKMSNDEFMSMF